MKLFCRTGILIKIFKKGETQSFETHGGFSNRDQIFQELFALQRIDGDNIPLQSFTVSGFYAGAGVRVEPSPIIVSASDLPALRVVDDSFFD